MVENVTRIKIQIKINEFFKKVMRAKKIIFGILLGVFVKMVNI